MTSSIPLIIPPTPPSGPRLEYVSGPAPDGGFVTTYAINRTPITDPHERALCRTLLVGALALHDGPTTPAAGELPPYSGEYTPCPKCGHDSAITRYRSAGKHGSHDRQTLRRSTKGERLERECWRCDYTWDEALNPPDPAHPDIGQEPDAAVTVGELADALSESHDGWALDLTPACAHAMAEQLHQTLLIRRRPSTPAAAGTDQSEAPA